ncbi:hypothetical protein BC829DRAFT_384708 [Chytridium lagenaria]|nr:hypothetical protein BC829DRAFT_384708 [Chytridium lagenaria]
MPFPSFFSFLFFFALCGHCFNSFHLLYCFHEASNRFFLLAYYILFAQKPLHFFYYVNVILTFIGFFPAFSSFSFQFLS